MSYTKHDFKSGEKLYASQLNEMDEQIFKNTEETSKLSEEIVDLKENGAGSGLTQEAKTALLNCFRNVAWTVSNGQDYYNALETALNGSGSSGGEDSGDTEKTLTSISATYTGGDVYAGALLTDLSGITVTAHYSDGSTANVTSYTLSGEILEGSNIITVSYGGKTTTFTVKGIVDEEDETSENDPPFDTVTWTEGLRISGGGKEYTGHVNYSTTNYVDVSGIIGKSVTLTRSSDVSGNVQYFYEFYDSEKVYISGTGSGGYINADHATYLPSVTFEVPEGAVYCRICGTKLSGVTFSELIRITVA